ncbi:MAG: ABC transporter permease [Rhodobiaceae bacterium]|nr:ABC transporter permease [Rhodobiaceae bacterium]MCC0055164.1 ABC transporter permease [Rhodobiaceae bacterium]
MSADILIAIFVTVITASTPVLIAGLGALVVEKSGVLNLGVEGMMLIGAVTGFAMAATTGSPTLGFIAAIVAGAAASMVFAVLTLTLAANQVATGLALTIFGTGLSALAGKGFVGRTVDASIRIFPDVLALHPLGRLIFSHHPMVYLSLVLTVGVAWFLSRSRAGLILRAVGESADAAHSIGYNVIAIRYLAVAFGGAMAGLGGACFSLMLTPMWSEKLTAGRGWIALALVVFASWRPGRLLAGAYLFGLVMTLELHAKAAGFGLIAPEVLAMMPYLATILVLTIISMRPGSAYSAAPACLGKPFRPPV